MFYREAGQFKTSYEADRGDLPAAAGSHRHRADPVHRDRGRAADHVELHDLVGDDPGADLRARGDRAEHPHRLHRPDLARHRRLHGGRRLRLLQAHDLFPRREHRLPDPRLRLLLGGGRRAVRPAVAAHQGLLSRGRDARGAVLPVVVLHPHTLALQLQHLRRDRGADPHAVRRADHRPDRDAGRALSRRARHRHPDDLARLQPGARPHRADVDGGARHGHRGRADRHPALPHQAARVCGVVVLLRRRRAP